MRPLILSLIMMGLTACDAKAPPVREEAYVLREAYVRDTGSKGKPFTYKDCEINKGFRKANPSPIEGYEHVFYCVPIGER